MQEAYASAPPRERVRFVMESPEMHASDPVQQYVQQEVDRPTKAWAQEVINNTRESEFVKLRTPEFVLLPDQNNSRRTSALRHRAHDAPPAPRYARAMQHRAPHPHHAARRFNWLSIVTDPGIRSIRDLRAEHLPILEGMYTQCVRAIQAEYRVGIEDIMVFANYPPSVYKLHFHFCAPFFQPAAYDAFRMHSLSSIINNLRLHSGYYAESTFQIPVHSNSELYRAISASIRGGAARAENDSSTDEYSDDDPTIPFETPE